MRGEMLPHFINKEVMDRGTDVVHCTIHVKNSQEMGKQQQQLRCLQLSPPVLKNGQSLLDGHTVIY